MYINELGEGAKLAIQVKIGKETLEFETKSMTFIDRKVARAIEALGEKMQTPVLVIPAIKKNGKVINFLQPGIRVVVTAPTEGVLHVWQEGVTLRTVALQEATYHMLCCKTNGMTINRREHLRVGTGGLAGSVQMGMNSPARAAVIEDVSENGIGLTVQGLSEDQVRMGGVVNITFEDSILDARNGSMLDIHYKFAAIIVRFLKSQDASTFFLGCKINTSNPISAEGLPFSRYIAYKQKVKKAAVAAPEAQVIRK